jgi:hypothetical protein
MMTTNNSEHSFPDWLKVTETAEILCLDIDKKSSSVQHGHFEPSCLADSSLENIPYQGKIVRINGAATTWIYSFFAYSAYQHEAKQIEVFYPEDNKYILIYPTDTLENSDIKDNDFNIKQDQGTLIVTLNSRNSQIGAQINPLKLPQTDSFLILTGRASLFLYAYAVVVAAMNKFQFIFVDNPQEPYLISVGKMTLGNVVRKNQTTNESGLVVGVVGDSRLAPVYGRK